jgi:hypothetical protein
MVLLTWTMSLDASITISYIGYNQFTANELFSTEVRENILETFKEELNQVLINVY